jgi:hypothetical protein
MSFPILASSAIVLLLLNACTQMGSTIFVTTVPAKTGPATTGVGAPAKPVTSSPPAIAPKPVPAPSVSVQPAPAKPVKPAPAKPAPAKTPEESLPVVTTPDPVTPGGSGSTAIQASDVYLNHFCLLSDHTNLCSRTSMNPDPGHSLKLEPMNSTGRTLTGTLVIEYDASKIEPAADGHLRHSVKHTTTAFERSPGKLTIRNFVVHPGKDYQYLWNHIKPTASGTVIGKATFSWQQDDQIKYAMGCYEFELDSQGGNDNIQGLEKSKFNGYGSMDCGSPSIPN